MGISRRASQTAFEGGIRKRKHKWVLATLGEIDPCDVSVQDLSAKPGEKQEVRVRRSVGLPPAQRPISMKQIQRQAFPTTSKILTR